MAERHKPQRAGEPERPQGPEEPETYKFNLGLFRINAINEMLDVCARRYHKALLKKEPRYIHKYQAIVNTLFTETYIYMEKETDIEHLDVEQNKDEVLRNILDKKHEYGSEEEMMQHIQKIRNIYLSVRQLLKDVGLDIPKEQRVGKTDIFNK